MTDHVYEQRKVHTHEEHTEPTLDGSNGNDVELVDYENNIPFWLPPEPEDEEDREALLFDNDDDSGSDCATGSSSLGGGEYQTRDRSHDKHKKAMKKVDDEHFRNLITQLLQGENVPVTKDGEESWVNIITSLSWEAVTLFNPDTSMVRGMDPGEYVKVKYLASGCRSERYFV